MLFLILFDLFENLTQLGLESPILLLHVLDINGLPKTMRLPFDKHTFFLVDIKFLFLFLGLSVKLIFVNLIDFDLNLLFLIFDQFNLILKLLYSLLYWLDDFNGLFDLDFVKFLFD